MQQENICYSDGADRHKYGNMPLRCFSVEQEEWTALLHTAFVSPVVIIILMGLTIINLIDQIG